MAVDDLHEVDVGFVRKQRMGFEARAEGGDIDGKAEIAQAGDLGHVAVRFSGLDLVEEVGVGSRVGEVEAAVALVDLGAAAPPVGDDAAN